MYCGCREDEMLDMSVEMEEVWAMNDKCGKRRGG